MLSEIGSNFWITPDEIQGDIKTISPSIFNCAGSDYVWLSTGRSAISYVIQTIKDRFPNTRKIVCLPSFTCHTVYEPFLNAGYKIVTLPIGRNLKSNADDIYNVIKECNAGVVLFHKYFGFETLPNINNIIPKLRNMGVVIIEDCTQSMFSNIERIDADFYVGSIRKWCGVPDGAFAVCKDGIFYNKPDEYDRQLEQAKRYASELKYKYIIRGEGEKQPFLEAYRDAEKILSNQSKLYKIGELSQLIFSNIDIENLVKHRNANGKRLLSILINIDGVEPVFKTISEGVAPLYLPILCTNRSALQKLLVENSIYAPIVWPKGDNCPSVCDDADYLYEHLLCVPIDQRYHTEDIDRIGRIITSHN